MTLIYTPAMAETLLAEAKENLAKVVDALDTLNSLKNCTNFVQDEELVVMYRHATGLRYAIQRLEKPLVAQRRKVAKGKLIQVRPEA